MSARPRIEQPALEPGQVIDDATVWGAADYPDDRSWVHALDDAMRDEIVAAARRLLTRGIAPKDVRPEDFPLPRTAALLHELYAEVECAPGFAMLSGFPLDGLAEDEIRAAYCGLCSHLGTITVQNRDGEFILEVTDKGKNFDAQSRGYHSTAHLDFHNDGTNTVTLLCTETAVEGGKSKLLSAAAVYNAVVREHPELLPVVHRGFHHHRRDQRLDGEAPVTEYRSPIFGFFNGLLHTAYTDSSIRFCEAEGVVFSNEERTALDFVKSVTQREDLHVTMWLEKGDIQFVNNYLVLHARTAYTDAPDRRRRLLRLWLDDENSARLGPGKMDWYMPEHSRFTRTGGIASLPR